MRHYVVIIDWANVYESGSGVLGVAHSLEEAKVIFEKFLPEEKEYARTHGFEVHEDCETVFDAGEEGFYVAHHVYLYIQMV